MFPEVLRFKCEEVEVLMKHKMNDAVKYNMKKKTIADISDFSAWKNVFVEYADFAGDAIARDGENAMTAHDADALIMKAREHWFDENGNPKA